MYAMGVIIIGGEGAVIGVNLEHSIVTNGDILSYLCESVTLFPNNFMEDLLLLVTVAQECVVYWRYETDRQ